MSEGLVAETKRLRLRRVVSADAEFMYRLMTDPTWIENIGDRGLREVADARRYIDERLIPMYAEHGFGLYVMELKSTSEPVGICGPLRRSSLPEPDLGYALLPAFAGRGLAREAALRSLQHARDDLGLRRILAICKPENARSIRLLEAVGFTFEKRMILPPAPAESSLYSMSL